MSTPHIRWFIQDDLPRVLEIERASFEFPWDGDEFRRCLSQKEVIGMVAEVKCRIVGYMVYRLTKSDYELWNFAVDPQFRRQGIGRAMAEKLVDKLSTRRRSRIIAHVRESNLGMQLFLRQIGFRCIFAEQDFYDDTTEDAYRFEFQVHSQMPDVVLADA